ncbi:MAG: hypothetical protein EOP66_07925 [Sphingomonas sp.]|nr:MAG: hypothetical protein EOP66_07925 [Sphingomonas sp.]
MSDATMEMDTLEAVEALGATVIWDGSPKTLTTLGDTLLMPQTPNGSTVFAYQNKSTLNNAGQLALSSGSTVQMLDADFGVLVPSIYIGNWQANNLTVNNISQQNATPIWVEAFGPGLPGQTTVPISVGTALVLNPAPGATSVAQGVTPPKSMMLRMTSTTGDASVIALIGGPPDKTGNNAYVFGLNVANAGTTPGYTQVTGGNTINYSFNWGASVVYIANMSASTAAAVTLTLVAL